VLSNFRRFLENRLRPCSDILFMTRPETKIQRKEVEEIVNTEFLRGNTSSPTEVKKTMTYLCRIFNHFTIQAKQVTM